ncbi:prepilin-type N-terminal cleavage/methylation domain-containing protein [bacterium]|nr:prepilin-type N-terminal cleavage/methylation domain-containing protein [bacterium]
MNKKGFTLAEMLISLGTIGVIAAITIPSIVGTLPCKSKINFLKAYGSFSSVIADITSDDDLYYYNIDACPNVNLTCINAPLVAQPAPANVNNNFASARDKLARLVASRMNLTGNYNAANCSFTTTDGTVWTFNAANGINVARVTMQVLGEDDTTRTFTATVDRDGGITLPDFEREVLRTSSDTKKNSFKTLMNAYRKTNN